MLANRRCSGGAWSLLVMSILLCPSGVLSATYYVKNGGDDHLDGTSDATAWATIERLNRGLESAPAEEPVTIRFRRGDTWTVISGRSVLTVKRPKTTVTSYGGGPLPVFDGKDVDWGPGVHGAIIQVTAPDCTIESLEVRNAHGNGIQFTRSAHRGRVRHCRIHHVGWAGIMFYKVDDALVEQCEVSWAGLHGDRGPHPEADGWPQAIAANNSETDHCLFRYNFVHDTFTEGIGASNHAVEYNIVGPSTSVGIYAGEEPGIIRYNLVYGTVSGPFNIISRNGRQWCGHGIGLNAEVAERDPSGHRVYGNIVIGRYDGIRVMNATLRPVRNVRIYENTLIDNAYNFFATKADTYSDIRIINNLSVVYDRAHCRHVLSLGNLMGWTIRPNQWSSPPEVKEWWDPHRDEISDPQLPKRSGWTLLTGPEDFRIADLYPPPDSTAVDNPKALRLGPGYDARLLAAGTEFRDLPEVIRIVLADQSRHGRHWDFGACVRLHSIPTPPGR